MTEETAFVIKTVLDDKGFVDLENRAERTLGGLAKDVGNFNKNVTVSPDTKDLEKNLKVARNLLDELTVKRQIVLAKPDTKEARKELASVDTMIKKVTEKRQVYIDVNKEAINKSSASRGICQ